VVFLYPRQARDQVERYFRSSYDGDYGAAEASDDRTPVFESVFASVSAYRRTPGSVLDIGCGDGEFLTLCRSAGWACAGIELSQGAAARAAKRGFTMLPPQTLEQPDGAGSFDAVTLINVLEHVVDPLIMLRQAARALSSDGVLVVRATNGAFHLAMRAPARWIGSRHDQAFHWYLYTAKALRRLMEVAGLTVIGLRNSTPSRGPVSPAHPWWSRVKWTISRGLLWPAAQAVFAMTGGRMVCAPSFEMAARKRGVR
jgi:2-polyprenyl-3-methyl-5-hydroxy-6-metoxy-1,4-benzoquinol methylase